MLMTFEKSGENNDTWIEDLFAKHGLDQDSTMSEVQIVVKRLWADLSTRLDAIELGLLRKISFPAELSSNPDLKRLVILSNPDTAFEGLMQLREAERFQYPDEVV